MGRSSRTQADENRGRIVEAASRLFRVRGVDAVSVSDVMKAVGMTQGGFYRHFESKDALAAEACTHAFNTALAKWQSLADKAKVEGRDPVAAIVEHYLTPKPPGAICPMIALANDAARRPPGDVLQTSYDDGVRRLIAAFIDIAGVDHGDQAARARFAGMVGANMLATSAASAAIFRQLSG